MTYVAIVIVLLKYSVPFRDVPRAQPALYLLCLWSAGIAATPCILPKEPAKYKKILRLCAMAWLVVPGHSDVP